MITDQDVTKLRKTFLTHTEFKKYAKTFLTHAEFKKAAAAFATKMDLAVLRYEVGDLRLEVAEIKDTVDSIHNKLDKFLGNYERLDSESKVCTVVQRRHTKQIEALAANARFILPA